jgi:hypothetical protein
MAYMNTPNDSFPQICSEVGVFCESCVSGTARELASVCKGLTGKMMGQLFVQIHPNSACAPMHKRFTMRYREASQALAATVAAPLPEPIPMRREVMFARPRTTAAVA